MDPAGHRHTTAGRSRRGSSLTPRGLGMVFFSSGASEPAPIMGRSHHEPIVDAIEAGDTEEARRTLLSHMNEASEHWAPDIPVLPTY